MALEIKGFSGGMNKDLSPSKTPSNILYDANNIRILTDEGLSSFSILNTRGNSTLEITNATDASDAYDRTGYSIVGVEAIRNDFIIFWANNTNNGYGVIDKLIWDEDTTYTKVELYKSTSNQTALDFFPNQRLETQSSYEGEDNIRIYFTNEYYPLRIINVAPEDDGNPKLEASYTSLRGSSPESFDRTPFINHVTPKFQSYGSGSLLSGVYQYAYRLVTKVGTYSSISPASELIATSPSIRNKDFTTLRGADSAEDTNSGVAVNMQIDLGSQDLTNFETIEVFSLYYDEVDAIPTIYIIEQAPLNQSIFNFTDEAPVAKYGTLTYEEFTVNTYDFSAATLETKDNRLFAANIKERGFDVEFDARAYRFNSLGTCTVVNNSVEKTIVRSGASAPYTYTIDGQPIPEDADLINQANTDEVKNFLFNTQVSGTGGNNYAYGGEGPNVSYTFDFTEYEVVGYDAAGKTELSVGITTANEPYLLGRKKGFKRGEVYRFGIVFYSDKGVPSPVKWIGDILIPYANRSLRENIVSQGKANLVMPEFVVNTAGTEAYGLDYQIVYVPLNEQTRRIVAEGFLNQLIKEHLNEGGKTASYHNPCPYPWTIESLDNVEGRIEANNALEDYPGNNGYMVTFGQSCGKDFYITHKCYTLHSPEQTLLEFNYESGLELRIDGYMKLEFDKYDTQSGRVENETIKGTNLKYLNTSFKSNVHDLIQISQDTSFTTLDRFNDTSIIVSGRNGKIGSKKDPTERNWYGPKCIALSVEDQISNGFFSGNPDDLSESLAKATLFRNITPYNGHTYADRLLSIYVPASDVMKGAAVVKADRGDTVITYFDTNIAYWPIDISGSSQGNPVTDQSRAWMQALWFPTESRVNNYLRHDNSYFRGGGALASDSDSTIYNYLIQEKGNPTGDLFLYDNVYSKVDTSKQFAPIGIDDDIDTSSDVMVRYSEVKQQGEEIDQWAIFKANNRQYAQAEFGPINRLIEFNNLIYFFQDTGFGVIVINPRATISSQEGLEVALGTGATLERFNYISTEIGSQKDSDIIKSLQAIYWLDRLKKKFYKFTGQLESLSDLKGLSGYFRQALTEDSKLRGIYDNEYADVYLTVGNAEYITIEQTIQYNETTTQEYYEIQDVQEDVISKPAVEVSVTTRVEETSYVELDFIGATNRFTAELPTTVNVTDNAGVARFNFTGTTVAEGQSVIVTGYTVASGYSGIHEVTTTDGSTYFEVEGITFNGTGTGKFFPITANTFMASDSGISLSEVIDSLQESIRVHVNDNNFEYVQISRTNNVIRLDSLLEGATYNFNPVVDNNTGEYSFASTTISGTVISENSTISLTYGASIVVFTAKDSPSGTLEFQAGSNITATINSLETVINNWFISEANTDYTVTNQSTSLLITANIAGPTYDITAIVNNVTSTSSQASATIEASAVKEDSTITLTFTGTQVTFTAKNTPVAATDFQASQTQATVLSSITSVINTWLTTNGNTDYVVNNTGTSVTVTANTGGSAYDLNAQFFNNALNNVSTEDYSGNAGVYDVTGGAQNITEDGTFVICDFSTAGGVDRLDLYKNGSVVAQSGILQGSNYGFPNLDIVAPYVVGRLSTNGKDYKPPGTREMYQGEWNSGTTYTYGDIVKVTGSPTKFYVSETTNNTNNDPTVSGNWLEQPVIGGFETVNDSSPGSVPPAYNVFCFRAAFIGTNTGIAQDPATLGTTNVETGKVPTRYQDYLDDGGPASEDWLGNDGDAFGAYTIRGGVVSHFPDYSPTNEVRGQRIWAKYDNGDTYEVKVSGAGAGTGWRVTYFVLNTTTSDLNVIDTPSATVPTPSDYGAVNTPSVLIPITSDLFATAFNSTTTQVTVQKPVLITDTFITTISKKVNVTSKTSFWNRLATLAVSSGQDITHQLTGLLSKYRFNKYVDYSIGGAIFTVTQIDFNNNIIYLNLVEGTPTLGLVDVSDYLQFRNPFTLTYNEILNAFTSFHSFYPTLYAKGSRYFFTTENDKDLYEHNTNTFGTYYGTTYDTTFDLITPVQIVNEFTNVSWFSQVNSGSEELADKTIYSIKAYTDLQESDEVVFYKKDSTRIVHDTEGTRLPNDGVSPDADHPYSTMFNLVKNADSVWRASVPRIKEEPADKYNDDLTAIITDGREFRERVRGGFARLRFRIKNTGNEDRYVIDDIRIKTNTTWH